MKFKFIFLIFLLYSCASHNVSNNKKESYLGTGFAYVYNSEDYQNKIINKRFNDELLIGHNFLKPGTLVILTNLENKRTLKLKVSKKVKYPDFYKVLLTKKVVERLDLDIENPLIEIREVKKNKSFVAKKAKTFDEEQKISNTAPVEKVVINEMNSKQKQKKTKKFHIIIGDFYSLDTTTHIKQRITKEIPNFDIKLIKTTKKRLNNKPRIEMTSGPYSSINSLKDDYILLKDFGFEDLNILVK